jgi:anti-sigma factor RsiW
VLVPAVSGSAQEVSVNGQTGAFIASRDGSQSVMFWQQNGIWYGLAGRMTLAQAQAMALGLK